MCIYSYLAIKNCFSVYFSDDFNHINQKQVHVGSEDVHAILANQTEPTKHPITAVTANRSTLSGNKSRQEQWSTMCKFMGYSTKFKYSHKGKQYLVMTNLLVTG